TAADNVFGHVGGFDKVDGRAGNDTLDFSRFASAVWVDLSYSGAPGEAWTMDRATLDGGTWRAIADVASVENVVGSAHSDQLWGGADDNVLAYSGGFD